METGNYRKPAGLGSVTEIAFEIRTLDLFRNELQTKQDTNERKTNFLEVWMPFFIT